MTDYWDRIRKTLSGFAQPNDTLECVGIFRNGDGEQCQLCIKARINWVHLLYNVRSGEMLRVGSECILNYEEVMPKSQQPVQAIKFPPYYVNAAAHFNKQKPNTIIVGKLSSGGEAKAKRERELNRLRQKPMDTPTTGFGSASYFYGDDNDNALFDYEEDEFEDLAPEGMGYDDIDWETGDVSDSDDNDPNY